MKDNKKLPEAELKVMFALWDANDTVTSEYVAEKLNNTWAKPTLLNLLNRLIDRGFVKCEKNGKLNYYTALIKKDDYLKKESISFLENLHKNSLMSLLTSLYDGKKFSKEEIEELKKFIEEAK